MVTTGVSQVGRRVSLRCTRHSGLSGNDGAVARPTKLHQLMFSDKAFLISKLFQQSPKCRHFGMDAEIQAMDGSQSVGQVFIQATCNP